VRLLLINPNTSDHITARLAASARAALDEHDVLTAVNAATGPAAVRTAAHLRVAENNALALAAEHAGSHDAIVLAISLDGAAPRLRRKLPGTPVIGMTEGALFTACLQAERVGLLTLGEALLPLYRRRIEEIGMASRMAGYEAAESESAFGDSEIQELPLLDLLAAPCRRLRDAGAESIVLAGAVLCGYARPLESLCAIPVLDGVECAVRQARAVLGSRRAQVLLDARPGAI